MQLHGFLLFVMAGLIGAVKKITFLADIMKTRCFSFKNHPFQKHKLLYIHEEKNLDFYSYVL